MNEKEYIFSRQPIPTEKLRNIPLDDNKIGNLSQWWILNPQDFPEYSNYPYLYEIEIDNFLWTDRQKCSKKKKDKCLDSSTCFWSKDKCQIKPGFEKLPFEDFNKVIKKNKYYILANRKISLKDLKKVPLEEQSIVFIPQGWFVAKGKEWLDHFFNDVKLSREEFNDLGYTHLYEVTLNPEEIIFIRNEKDFERFNRKFEREREWRKIKGSGIFITRNFKSEAEWYRSFLFPSGIIWNRKGVKKLDLIYENQ